MRKPNDLEYRVLEDVNLDGRTVYGYAIVFNELSEPFDWGFEIIEPGAVDEEILSKSDIFFVTDHDIKYNKLGRSKFMKSGTLKLNIDEKGLRYEIELPNTTLANDLLELIKNGTYQGASFAFTIDKEEVVRNSNGTLLRKIQKFKRLYDISVVTSGQYEAASVGVRSKSVDEFLMREYHTEIRSKYNFENEIIEKVIVENRQLNDDEKSKLDSIILEINKKEERERIFAEIDKLINETLSK